MVGPAKIQTKASGAGVRTSGLPALWRERNEEPSGDIALSVQGLEGATLRDLSFDVRRGEIVGIAGLSDSGVTELPKILAGLLAPRGGQISVNGKPVPLRAAQGPSSKPEWSSSPPTVCGRVVFRLCPLRKTFSCPISRASG